MNEKGAVTDYFTFDFDLDELLALRKGQVDPRRASSYDWVEGFVTLSDFLSIARGWSVGAYVGIRRGDATNKVIVDER